MNMYMAEERIPSIVGRRGERGRMRDEPAFASWMVLHSSRCKTAANDVIFSCWLRFMSMDTSVCVECRFISDLQSCVCLALGLSSLTIMKGKVELLSLIYLSISNFGKNLFQYFQFIFISYLYIVVCITWRFNLKILFESTIFAKILNFFCLVLAL